MRHRKMIDFADNYSCAYEVAFVVKQKGSERVQQ